MPAYGTAPVSALSRWRFSEATTLSEVMIAPEWNLMPDLSLKVSVSAFSSQVQLSAADHFMAVLVKYLGDRDSEPKRGGHRGARAKGRQTS
jgi:hypothetical protein